jgi:flagellin-like protein
MSHPHRDQGVSVIIGTLLLILITVTAAAALALMVSQMQKAEETRQSQIQAVKDEQIVISGVRLVNNQTLWSSSPFNISDAQNWSSVSFNLMNLNTQAASVMGISISPSANSVYYAYPLNFSSLSGSSPGFCNLTSDGGGCPYLNSATTMPYLIIPAGGSIRVTMNLTGSLNGDAQPPVIGTEDQIDIKVLTSLTNIFEQTYRLPTPVIAYSSATKDLANNIQQDSMVFDGSQSSAINATISNWNWVIRDANGTFPNPGNCSDTANLVLNTGLQPSYSGKVVQISPPAAGPFCASLTVTDSNGMVATTSQDQLIPQDALFAPPSYLSLDWQKSSHQLNITVYNINNKPVPGQSVSYTINQNADSLPFNWTLNPLYGSLSQTDAYGNVSYYVYGNGTATISSGQLATKSLSFSGNY